jgi:hypothetical protein
VVVVLALAGAVRAAWHVIVTAVEVLAIAGVCVAGLAVLAVVSYAVYRVRRAALAARSRPAPYRVEVITDAPGRRPAPRTAALEAPRTRPAAWPWAGRGGAEDGGMVGRYVD